MTDPVVADVLRLALVHVLGACWAGVTRKAGAPGRIKVKIVNIVIFRIKVSS